MMMELQLADHQDRSEAALRSKHRLEPALLSISVRACRVVSSMLLQMRNGWKARCGCFPRWMMLFFPACCLVVCLIRTCNSNILRAKARDWTHSLSDRNNSVLPPWGAASLILSSPSAASSLSHKLNYLSHRSIPKAFRWLSERYPLISQLIQENRIPEFGGCSLCLPSI